MLGLVGCGNSPEDTCETACDFEAKCGEVDASSCKSECVKALEDAGDDCQDAAADYADCVEDIDSCNDEDLLECVEEAFELLGKCPGLLELDTES